MDIHVAWGGKANNGGIVVEGAIVGDLRHIYLQGHLLLFRIHVTKNVDGLFDGEVCTDKMTKNGGFIHGQVIGEVCLFGRCRLEDDGQVVGKLIVDTLRDFCKSRLAPDLSRKNVAIDGVEAFFPIGVFGREVDSVEVINIFGCGQV